jgi:hypothetical protein
VADRPDEEILRDVAMEMDEDYSNEEWMGTVATKNG